MARLTTGRKTRLLVLITLVVIVLLAVYKFSSKPEGPLTAEKTATTPAGEVTVGRGTNVEPDSQPREKANTASTNPGKPAEKIITAPKRAPKPIPGPASKVSALSNTHISVGKDAQALDKSTDHNQETPVGVGPITDPSPTEIIDMLLDRLEFANIAFNAPSSMDISDSPKIQLLLSLAETENELKASIKEAGDKVGATIKVNNKMQARLSGYMFQITAITPEEQAVSRSKRTEWSWEIHPKKEGKHDLHLTLSAIFEVNGRETTRVVRTFDQVIEVNVTASQQVKAFIKGNWQWLWAAILVPLAGWLWKQRRSR